MTSEPNKSRADIVPHHPNGTNGKGGNTQGIPLTFRRGEMGMWHWVLQGSATGAPTVSREAFSNIKDCEKDAMRRRKSRAP